MIGAQLAGWVLAVALDPDLLAVVPFAVALAWGIEAGRRSLTLSQCEAPAIAGAMTTGVANTGMCVLFGSLDPLDLPVETRLKVYGVVAVVIMCVSASIVGGALVGGVVGARFRRHG